MKGIAQCNYQRCMVRSPSCSGHTYIRSVLSNRRMDRAPVSWCGIVYHLHCCCCNRRIRVHRPISCQARSQQKSIFGGVSVLLPIPVYSDFFDGDGQGCRIPAVVHAVLSPMHGSRSNQGCLPEEPPDAYCVDRSGNSRITDQENRSVLGGARMYPARICRCR